MPSAKKKRDKVHQKHELPETIAMTQRQVTELEAKGGPYAVERDCNEWVRENLQFDTVEDAIKWGDENTEVDGFWHSFRIIKA